MNNNTVPPPVNPPTAVSQWTAADLAAAKAAGRHDLITQAHDAGQLHDLLNQQKPEPPRTTPRWSAPITNSDADLARARHTTDTFNEERNNR